MGDGKKGRGKKDKGTRVLREKKEQAIKTSKRSGNDMSWIYPVSRAERSTHPDKCQVPLLTLDKGSIQQPASQELGDGAAR